MVSMSQAVTDFRASEEYQRLSKSAKKRQNINLARLLKETDPKSAASSLRRAHVDHALNQARLRNPDVAESTLNTYRTDFRRFGKWISSNSDYNVKLNPAAHLTNKKTSTPPRKRKPATTEQAREMIKIAESWHPRDGMTIMLLLHTGLRESEVAGLTWGDVNLEIEESRVKRPKIDDYHPVYYTEQLTEALTKWKNSYEQLHGPVEDTWYVVPARAHIHEGPGRQNAKMNPSWPMVPTRPQTNITRRVKKLLGLVGVQDLKGKGSHTLRRTAGNILYTTPGVTMQNVQDFFGHSTPRQSEDYLDIDVRRSDRRASMRRLKI